MPLQYILTLILIAALLIISARYQNQEKLRWLAVGISLFLTVRYLYWRAAYTLNTADAVSLMVSITIYLAEIYGFFQAFLFYFQVATPTKRSSSVTDHPDLPTVDVFVTSFDEGVDIIRRTLIGCLAMDYPEGKTSVYLLDDGGREEMKQLTQDLHCSYLTRSTREHAKAGNLNNALKFSRGEFIVNFDADHIPVKTFLKKTIGFFSDPKVAIVQTPHYFYNPDIYQRNLRMGGKLAHEQDLFFQIIQPGRDFTNSSFYCGSGAVISREALDKIGGFVTRSVTEDIHTTMRIHALGYRTVYVKEILAVGLSPESFRSYLKQRQRWTKGHLQIFLSRDNPLLLKGLTLVQRINYFSSIYYFLFGPSRMIYLAVPLAFLLFDIPPLIASLSDIVNFYGSHFLGALISFSIISGRYRNPFWSDVYETVMCFSLTASTLQTLLNPRKILFNVTPKGQKFAKSEMDVRSALPHLCFVLILGLGMILGIYKWLADTVNQDALIVSLILGSYNLILLVCAIFAGKEGVQKRSSFRLEREIPCELSFDHHRVITRTADVSERGLGICLDQPVFLPDRVRVRLIRGSENVETEGTVVCNDETDSGKYYIGIKFNHLTPAVEQGLIKMIYTLSESWKVNEKVAAGFGQSFIHMLISPFRTLLSLKNIRRSAPRIKVSLQCNVRIAGKSFGAYVEDISSRGLRIVLPKVGWPALARLDIQVYHQGQVLIYGQGQWVWQKRRFNKNIAGIRWAVEQPGFYETWLSIQ